MEHINILIIEDEQRLAEILKKQFEESGFHADIALPAGEFRPYNRGNHGRSCYKNDQYYIYEKPIPGHK